MIGPKGFFALAIPLTLSVYSLLLSIWGITILPIWASAILVVVFGAVSVAALLRLAEKEEMKLLSDHMRITE